MNRLPSIIKVVKSLEMQKELGVYVYVEPRRRMEGMVNVEEEVVHIIRRCLAESITPIRAAWIMPLTAAVRDRAVSNNINYITSTPDDILRVPSLVLSDGYDLLSLCFLANVLLNTVDHLKRSKGKPIQDVVRSVANVHHDFEYLKNNRNCTIESYVTSTFVRFSFVNTWNTNSSWSFDVVMKTNKLEIMISRELSARLTSCYGENFLE